ncbi:3-galactosyl-N-acetylglucosaminide 4-alpha-L-fucosyltransferase FUT3-like [Convolutriloba macropyga]|uniref:3-galactosyl-N-acetylglucosaminide 4-alpha-L-fucosyltransferase FUT3-like n=1 Tax=Convolutriloba macropyga TaxID=536237 RepID=UPI003F5207E0
MISRFRIRRYIQRNWSFILLLSVGGFALLKLKYGVNDGAHGGGGMKRETRNSENGIKDKTGEHPQGSNPAKIDPDLEVHMVALPDNPKLVGQDYRAKCPLNFNCHFHKGPQVKVENMDQYDVIVGRGPPGMQQLRKLWEASGKKRNPNQLWMSSHAEPVLNGVNHAALDNKEFDSLFNWTAYHSKNATFYNRIFHVRKNSQLTMEQVRSEYRKYNKTKAFCWAINNCNNGWTPRVTLGLEIIRKLPEKIHMFGSAASNCFKTAAEFIENHGSFGGSANPETSRQAHMRDCKFYFSFENSNCSGYITEKFNNPLQTYAVPIVNGWWASYKEQLPGSFIHAKQFPTIDELTAYLGYLLRNETAYLEYHRWRTIYTVKQHEESNIERECEMCQKAAEVKMSLRGPSPQISTIPSLLSYFKTDKFCHCNRHL